MLHIDKISYQKITGTTFLFLLIILFAHSLSAEGTKELMPSASDHGHIQIFDMNSSDRKFATYNAPDENRLYITICNPGEKIYMGFRQNNNDVYFRLKDPDGNIVRPAERIPSWGEGFINTHADAINGPREVTGAGYDAIEFTPAKTGDYYIEFNPQHPTDIRTIKRIIEYFDITVYDPASNQVKNGRLYSKNWDFQCKSDRNDFMAELYVYAKDSIVTALDFNGINGFGFTVSANSRGCEDTGDPVADRMSRYGNVTYPEYKIFLNNPDEDCYPSGSFGELTQPSTITGCDEDERCINIYVNKAGDVEIVLELNGVEGYQENTEDVIFSTSVEKGHNCISWNTRNGLGQIVPPGTEIDISVNYFNGLTHLPLFDVEHHRDGYIVNLVRPIPPSGTTKPNLFWDDSRLDPGRGNAIDGLQNLDGCNLNGCHKWEHRGINGPYMETINTWWYSNLIKDNATYIVETIKVDANNWNPLVESNDTTVCANVLPFGLKGVVTGATGGTWSGGEGTFSDINDLNGTYQPSQNEIDKGVATLVLTSTGNGDCPPVSDTMNIFILPAPVADPGDPQDICINNSIIQLNGSVDNAGGGYWSGGSGKFYPDSTYLSAEYTPSEEELNNGSVALSLTTTDNDFCPATTAEVAFNFTPAPEVNAGPDTVLCESSPSLQLQGSVVNATGGTWSSGNGAYSPDANTLETEYTASGTEVSNGSTSLILTSTGNGNCNPVSDTMNISFIPGPVVDPGTDRNICVGNNIQLDGSVSNAESFYWSGGSGTFLPDENTLNTTYMPSAEEANDGNTITLTLTGVDPGSCFAVSEDIEITFTPGPTVNAQDEIICDNNPVTQLSGSVSGATGGRWTGGNGTFSPDRNDLSAEYTPSTGELEAGNTILYLQSTGNGSCEPVFDTILIAVTTAPEVEAGPDQTICSNISSVSVSGTATNASSRSWTTSGDGSFSSSNQENSIYYPGSADISSGSVILTLNGSKGGCNNVSDALEVFFTPSPEVSAGPDRSVCENNASVALSGSVNIATGGVWTGGAGTFTPSADSLNATYEPAEADINSGSITLTLTTTGNGDCNEETDELTVDFTPAPIVDAGDDINICYNNPTLSLDGKVSGASSGNWTGGSGTFSPGSNFLSTSYTPSQQELDAGSFYLYLTSAGNGSCNAVTDSVLVTVEPEPEINAGPDQTVCADAPEVNLNASFSGATGGIWSGGTGTYAPSATAPNAVYTPTVSEIDNGSVNLTYTSTGNGNCNAVSDIMTINIQPAPSISAGPDQNICGADASLVLNQAYASDVSSVVWKASGNGAFNSTSVLTPEYNISDQDKERGSVNLIVTAEGKGACLPVSDTLRVRITEVPSVYAGPDRTLCTNSFPVTLQGNGTPGTWSGGTGTFSPGRGTMNATYTPSASELSNGSVTLTLTSTATGTCPPVSDDVTFTIIEGPEADAGPDVDICGNNDKVLLNGSASGSTASQWTTNGNGSFTDNTSLTSEYLISASDKADGNIQLRLIAGGDSRCPNAVDSLNLSITPEVTVNAGPDRTFCADITEFQLNGSYENATSASWTGGTGVFSDPTSATSDYAPAAGEKTTGSVTLTFTTASTGPCPAFSDQVEFTFTPEPTVEAGPDQEICADEQEIALSGNITVATEAKWSANGTGTFSPHPGDLNATYTPSAADIASGSVTFTLTTTEQGSCNPVSDQLTVNIQPEPVVKAGPDTTICKTEQDIQLKGSVTNAGGGIWTTYGTGSFSDATDLNTIYSSSAGDNSGGTVTLQLQSSDNGVCAAKKDLIIITYEEVPVVNAGNDLQVCASENEIAVSASAGNTTGGVWSTSGTGSFSDKDAESGAYFPSATDTANSSVHLIYTSTGTEACTSSSDSIEVLFDPVPVVNAGPDQTICADSNYIELNGIVTNAGGGHWRTTGTGTFSPSPLMLNSRYNISSSDRSVTSVDLILTSTENGACGEYADTMKLIITPAPEINIGPDQQLCSSVNATTLSGNVEVASGISWVSSGTGSFDNTGGLNNTYNFSQQDQDAGLITIIGTSTGNGTCKPVTDQMTISFEPAPEANAGPDIEVCSDIGTVSLNGTVKNATGGIWSTEGTGQFDPETAIAAPDYIPSSDDTAAGFTKLIYSTTGASICPDDEDTMTVFFDPLPYLDAGDDVTMCYDENGVDINATARYSAGVSWTTSGSGSFSPDRYSETITYSPSEADKISGNVTLTVTTQQTNECTAVSDDIEITITPRPEVNAGDDQEVCEDSEGAQLNGTVNNAQGVQWNTNGTGVFSPSATHTNAQYIFSEQDIEVGSVELVLASTGNNGCFAARDEMALTITPVPDINAGPDIDVCADVADIQLEAVLKNATGAFWQAVDGTGTFSPSNNQSSTTYTPSEADTTNGSVTFLAIATGTGSCNSPDDAVTVFFTTPPPVSAGPDKTVCSTELPIRLEGVGTSGEWLNGTGTFSPHNESLVSYYTPSSSEIAAGNVTLTLSSTNNGSCDPSTDEVTITITDGPEADAGGDDLICSDETSYELSGTFDNAAGITWSSSGTGTFDDNSQSNTSYFPSQDDIDAGKVTFTLTTTGNGLCKSVLDQKVLTIDPSPVVSAGNDLTVCEDKNSYDLEGSVDNATGGVWSTSGSGSFNSSGSLATEYIPSADDKNNGSVVLTLSSTGNGNCTVKEDSVIISITPLPAANAGDPQTICANQGYLELSGSVANAKGGIWTANGTGVFSPARNNNSLRYYLSSTDTAAGSVDFTFTTTGNRSCPEASDNVTVTINPEPSVDADFEGESICVDVSSMTLNSSYTNADGIRWSTSGNGTFDDNTSSSTIYNTSLNDNARGMVGITIKTIDNSGVCPPATDALNIPVTASPEAVVSAGNDQTVCADTDEIRLEGEVSIATGGTWTTPDGAGSFSPDNNSLSAVYNISSSDKSAESVTFVLTTTGNGLCKTSSDTMNLFITPAPVADGGADKTICASENGVNLDGTVNIATGGTWSSSGSGTFTPNANTVDATYIPSETDKKLGSVSLTLSTTGNGLCQAVTDNAVVDFQPVPAADAGPDKEICATTTGITVAASVSEAGGGVWSASGTGSFTDNSSLITVYNTSQNDIDSRRFNLLLTTTGNGVCPPANDNVTVTVVPAPEVNAGPDKTVCENISGITMNGTSLNSASIRWETNGTGIFLPNAESRIITFIPSDADLNNGSTELILKSDDNSVCSETADTATITFAPAPEVSTGNINTCDYEQGVQLNGTVQNAGGLIWNTSGSGSFSPGAAIPGAIYYPSPDDASPEETVVLTVTSTGNGVCDPDTAKALVTFTPPPPADGGPDQKVCRSNQAVFVAVPEADVDYRWTTTSGITISSNESVSVTADSDSSFVLTGTDGKGCINTDTVHITVVDPPALTLDDHYCLADSLILFANPQTTRSLLPGTYQWYRNNRVISGENTPYYITTNTGYHSIIYNEGSCSVSEDASITSPPSLDIENKIACTGTLTSLTTTDIPGSAYTWAVNGQSLADNSSSIEVTAKADTNFYVVSVPNAYGCIAMDSMRVIGINKPEFNVGDTSICANEEVFFVGRPTNISNINNLPVQYLWTKGTDTLSTTDSLVVDSKGNYMLDVTIGHCSGRDTGYVSLTPVPLPQLPEKIRFCADSDHSTVLAAEEGFNRYLWHHNGDTLNSTEVFNEGSYKVSVTNEYGCRGTDSVLVLNLCPPRLYPPTAFTPDNDYNNDVFRVYGKYFTNYELTIFNRWGEIIFHSNNPDEVWDGNYRGEPMPIGTYPYIIRYEGTHSDYQGPYQIEGSVTVIR